MGADLGTIDTSFDATNFSVGNSTGGTGGELIANGTFDDALGWSGDGVNAVNGINTATVSRAGNSYDVNMSTTVATQPDTDYTLTFDAKGVDGRLLYAGIGDDGGSYAADKQNLRLTDSWQTFTLHLNSAGQTIAPSVRSLRWATTLVWSK